MTDHFRAATKLMPDLARLREIVERINAESPLPWTLTPGGCVVVDAKNNVAYWGEFQMEVDAVNALPALIDAPEAWQRHTTQLHTLVGCCGCGAGVQHRYALTINGKPHCQTCAQSWIIRNGDMFSLMIERLNRAEGLEADNAALRECLREIVEHSRNGMTHAEWMEWGRLLHGRPNTVALALRAAELCGLTTDAGNHPVAPDGSREGDR